MKERERRSVEGDEAERKGLQAKLGFRDLRGFEMKKGAHPALQWISIVSPHGRLIRVLAGKAFKLDRPTYVRDPGKQSEAVGQLAKFKRRFDFTPKSSS